MCHQNFYTALLPLLEAARPATTQEHEENLNRVLKLMSSGPKIPSRGPSGVPGRIVAPSYAKVPTAREVDVFNSISDWFLRFFDVARGL